MSKRRYLASTDKPHMYREAGRWWCAGSFWRSPGSTPAEAWKTFGGKHG